MKSTQYKQLRVIKSRYRIAEGEDQLGVFASGGALLAVLARTGRARQGERALRDGPESRELLDKGILRCILNLGWFCFHD